MIKGLLCDLDDTLYSFEEIRGEAFRKLTQMASCKLGVSGERFAEAYREGRSQIKASIKGKQAAAHSRLLYCQRALELLQINPIEYAAEFSHFFWENCMERMQVRTGVRELFLAAKAQGMKIGICTDMQTEIQLQKLRCLRLAEWIDVVVTSEEVGTEKPDARMFQEGLRKLGILNTECLYIGDSYEKDVMGALNCGIFAIWFREEYGKNWKNTGRYGITGDFECVRRYVEGVEK